MEEALWSQVAERYAGSKNINQLIMEHIPSKTAKQISGKRRLLMKVPSKKVQQILEGGEEGKVELPQDTDLPKDGQLKRHYYDTIKKRLVAYSFASC